MPEFNDDQRRQLEARFREFDSDGNGKIDRAEFRQLTDALGAALSEPEAERAFSAIDKNANGSIEFEEFCSWWRFRV